MGVKQHLLNAKKNCDSYKYPAAQTDLEKAEKQYTGWKKQIKEILGKLKKTVTDVKTALDKKPPDPDGAAKLIDKTISETTNVLKLYKVD